MHRGRKIERLSTTYEEHDSPLVGAAVGDPDEEQLAWDTGDRGRAQVGAQKSEPRLSEPTLTSRTNRLTSEQQGAQVGAVVHKHVPLAFINILTLAKARFILHILFPTNPHIEET